MGIEAIPSTIKAAAGIVKRVAIMFVKLPLKLWFEYIPKPRRWVAFGMILFVSVIAIVWAIQHCNDWKSCYHYEKHLNISTLFGL